MNEKTTTILKTTFLLVAYLINNNEFLKAQEIISHIYDLFEQIQTENSTDDFIYSWIQNQLNELDNFSDTIRYKAGEY